MSKYQNLSLAEQFAELHTDTSKALADLATQLAEQTKISRRNTQLLEAILGVELPDEAADDGERSGRKKKGSAKSAAALPEPKQILGVDRFAQQSEAQQQALMEHLSVLAGKMDIASSFSTAGGYAIVLLDGFLFAIREREWRLAAFLNYRGYPEPGTVTYLKKYLKPKQHLLDIGAGYGILTIPAARLVEPGGKVWAFEPDPGVLPALEGNIKVNGFAEKDIITVCPVAAFDKDGHADFYVNHSDSSINSIFPTKGAKVVPVPISTVDDYLPAGERVEWAVIDVDGAEPDVLLGMKHTIAANPEITIIMKWAPSKLANNGGIVLKDWLSELWARFNVSAIREEDGETWQPNQKEVLKLGSVNLILRPKAAKAAVSKDSEHSVEESEQDTVEKTDKSGGPISEELDEVTADSTE